LGPLLLLLIAVRCLELAPPPKTEKLCTVEAPLISDCGKDFRHCSRVKFVDNETKMCYSQTSTTKFLKNLKCEKGRWIGIRGDMKGIMEQSVR
ncbi:hypothetical protein PENTCL1PPCAC_1221, partial [Pristionchus entomophagus]